MLFPFTSTNCFKKLKLCLLSSFLCLILWSRQSVVDPIVVAPPNPYIFTISTAFDSSYAILVTINITDFLNNAGVQIKDTESDPNKVGDLRGLFFNISDGFPLTKSPVPT
jgi:hypothetical protein